MGGILPVGAAYPMLRERFGLEHTTLQLDHEGGELLQIDEWNADGTASVKYRGAQWTVIHRPGNPPTPGSYRVAELVGSRLLVDKV